jgi:hypothetical protein
LNGSIAINTSGILTTVTCAIPNQISVNSSSATNWTVSATSADGCTVNATFDPNDSNQQYGVENVPNCGSNTTDPTFQPVCSSFHRSQPWLIPFRFSFGSGNKNQIALPPFSANRR